MTDTQMYAGKCKCKRALDMRLTTLKEKEDDPKSKILGWMVHGFCKSCKIVFMQGLFMQEEKPVEDRDFIIDWNEEIKEVDKCD